MIYLELFMPIKPIPKARPRFCRRGRSVFTYTPRRTGQYEDQVRFYVIAFMQKNKIDMALGPLSAEIVFYFPRPKSVKNIHHYKRPDLDNLCKGVFDALNGVVFKDDSQVCMLSVAKRYCQDTQQLGVLLRVEKLDQQEA